MGRLVQLILAVLALSIPAAAAGEAIRLFATEIHLETEDAFTVEERISYDFGDAAPPRDLPRNSDSLRPRPGGGLPDLPRRGVGHGRERHRPALPGLDQRKESAHPHR